MSRQLNILQFTDTHLLADASADLKGFDTETSLARVIEMATRKHADINLILVTGDITHYGEAGAYQRFRQYLQVFEGVPVCLLPGNHDAPEVMREIFARFPEFTFDPVSMGAWHIIPLDSTIENSIGGNISDAQLAMLDRELSVNADYHVLVTLHHQPVDMNSVWIDALGIDNAEALHAVLNKHQNVRAVLWGHVHQEYDQTINGVRYLASPSTCMQFLPGTSSYAQDPAAAPGYRLLQLSSDGEIFTTVHRL
jgi:Icc protein